MKRLWTPAEALREMGAAESAPTLRALQSGLTNRSYLVDLDGRPHVLRLDTGQAARIGLDRAMEARIQSCAAAAGLAPVIRYADPEAGILVYEYLPGRALRAGELAGTPVLEAIAAALRAVHGLPSCGKILATTEAALRYAGIVASEPHLNAFATRCVDIVSSTPPVDIIRCCHNDVVAGNCIMNGRLRLIDWEYACDNDPMFDLASLIAYHDLGDRPASALLAAYTGGPDAEERERLSLQCRLFDALQWLWLAAQQLLLPRARQSDRLVRLRERIR